MFEHIARQLRKPEGDLGKVVAGKMSTGNQLINEWTIEALALAPHDNILEIGMGNGVFVKKVTSGDASIKYTGIDYSPLMIEMSTMQNQARTAELRGRPVVGSRMIGDAPSTNCGAVGAPCPAVGGDHQVEPS